MPKFKPNPAPFRMKGYSYPGVSPMRQEKYTQITDGDGNLVRKKGLKKLTNKKKDLFHHKNTGPVSKSTPFTPPPPSNNKNKGTLKGITNFEYDFPKINKAIDLHNNVVKKGVNTIKKGGKKVYDYFTKK
jgi:hypothetical protein